MSLLYLYLNFLEPSRPRQACNGTALPLPYFMKPSASRQALMGLLNLYLNFLEPPGPRQACHGTARPFP